MKKLLLLFDQISVNEHLADPERLIELMQKNHPDARIDFEVLENLLFYVSGQNAEITSSKLREALSTYDMVYFRRMDPARPISLTTAIYLRKYNVPFVDSEAYLDTASLTKLSQLFRLWEHELPIPKTIFGVSQAKDLWFFKKHLKNFPVVVKATLGTRGSDNYLVYSQAELLQILAENPDLQFLIQEFIPNQEDFRVLVTGGEIKMIIKRTRSNGDSHKNNISLGGNAVKVPTNTLSKKMLDDCIKASHVLGRDVAGVDIVIAEDTKKYYFFEVNRSPQIEHSSFEQEKADILFDYLEQHSSKTVRSMADKQKSLVTIGRAEWLDLPSTKHKNVPARIDTGARTSAIWASNIHEKNGELNFTLFDKTSKYYTGEVVKLKEYSQRMVANSSGLRQIRYLVKIPVRLGGRKINASFTLADRSTQIYPILVGRNILHGKFVVDVEQGKPLVEAEKARQEEYERLVEQQKGNR